MGMADLTNFDEQMKKRVTEIKSIIQKYLPQEEGVQRTLLEAVNYSMLVGGKKSPPASDAAGVCDVRRKIACCTALYGSN